MSRPADFLRCGVRHKTRYGRRNVVERDFCQIKHRRGLATRHARDYLGGLTLAALLT